MSYETFMKSQLFTKKSANLTKLGFDFNGNAQSEYIKVQNLLMTKYHIENGSMITIMKEFNIPSSRTMDILFTHFDITARTYTEATSLSIQQNRSDPIKNYSNRVVIWHKTWDGKDVLLRSSLEKEFAMLLDSQTLKYEVETMRLKYFDADAGQYRIAIPDFYLPSQNRIVEVKSTYWLDAANMKAKSKAYRELGFSFSLFLDSHLLDDWE